jgi:hypothetical protein
VRAGTKTKAFLQAVVGAGLAVGLLAGLAEGFLRLFPPKDFDLFAGEASPLTGVFAPDADFGAGYRSWQAFCEDNAERISPYLALETSSAGRPTWAFFGNSFFQAPGMLGDTARAALTDRNIFYLGRNEPLYVRLAQIKLLLENGLRPERVFIELMPVDMLSLGPQPLATLHVTARGALTYRPRLPEGPAGWLVENLALARLAWYRSGRQVGNRAFRSSTLNCGLSPVLAADLDKLFGNLARVARQHDVPMTIVFIPDYFQVLHGQCFGFQESLTAIFRPQGYDLCDPRAAFLSAPDGPSLFLPDRHLTPRGNQLLLHELLLHVQAIDPSRRAATL